MRKAILLSILILLSSLPLVQAEEHTIHLWSEQAPGPVLLWNGTGVLTTIDGSQPIDIELEPGAYTLVRLIDGVPQATNLVFNEDTNATAFLNATIETPLTIQGSAHLAITGPIEKSTALNATWTSTTEIPHTLGHPDLPNAHLGIMAQLEAEFNTNLGAFSEWLSNNTEVGCCAYDRTDMVVESMQVTAFGSAESWGWNTTANLTGQADGRSTRLLWVPISGDLIDRTDLRITLPSPHEIRFSPQLEHITGLPDDFTLARGEIDVAGNATIALGLNAAPSADFDAANRTLPYLPAGMPSLFDSDCEDTSISEPSPRFILRDGNESLLDENISTLPVDPFFLGLTPGIWLNLTLFCTDPQGLVGNHSMDLYIDGLPPSRILDMQFMHPEDEVPTDIAHGEATIHIPSGSIISGAVQTSDDSSAPVYIEWTSNKTELWKQSGIGEMAWNDIFLQGPQANGQHLTIEDRHTPKPLTTYSLQLTLTDAAGNENLQRWDVIVTDRSAPHPRPALRVDGQYYGDLNHPVEGGSPVNVNLSESWDDIDGITALSWEVRLNGETLDVGNDWEEVREFTLPDLPTGRHIMTVNATDSSGNMGSHTTAFVVEPTTAAIYSVVEVVKVGDGGPGDSGALDVTVENHGQGFFLFRMCYLKTCTEDLVGVEANVDGPGRMTHRIPVKEWEPGMVVVRLELQDNSTIEYETDIEIEVPMTPMMWIFITLPLLAGLLAFWRLKSRPEQDAS